MEINADLNWYAIRTKSNQERIAELNLNRMGLEVFNPELKSEKEVFGVTKTVLSPLFPNYLFAKFNPSKYLHLIQYARGVRQVLRTGIALLPVEEQIIKEIRRRLVSGEYVQAEKLSSGSSVAIKQGAFNGLNAIFDRETSDRKRVVLLLDIMGVNAEVILDKRAVKTAV
ncbi:MAG: transcription termination/antitermination protein NusG [Pyrinomonadaceae bacterium]